MGDVSCICSTAQLKAATHAYGTPNHSWQQTTQDVLPLAHKMSLYAAKALAAADAEQLSNEELLLRAKAEHTRGVGTGGYICPIPKDIRPVPTQALYNCDS